MPKKLSPRSESPRQGGGGCFTFFFRFSQTMMFLLGLTYTIVILLPLLKRQNAILSNPSTSFMSAPSVLLESWSQNNPVGGSSCSGNTTKPMLERKNRTITLVHIGKAGGITLRRMTVVFCKLFFRRKQGDAKQNRIQRCTDKFFPDPGAVLAHSVTRYFHLEEFNETELAESTSFLLTLRNPVDRIISTYRYSHPANCNDDNRFEVWRPRGCEALKHVNKTGLIQNKIHYVCFPTPTVEDLAQQLMRPWKRGNQWNDNLSKEERRNCRYMAREMVQGQGTYGSGPHMLYNYEYYATRSVWKFPDKEVFGIRTEHEMEDIKALDTLMGGNGNLRENTEVSHGSESYHPSPVSTQAYRKLCCVLELEIEVYQDLVERVINLDDAAKRQCMETVRTKCGINTTWTQWRQNCRKQLRKDLRFLHPSLIVNETKYHDDAPRGRGHQAARRQKLHEDP